MPYYVSRFEKTQVLCTGVQLDQASRKVVDSAELVMKESDLHQRDIASDECARKFIKALSVMGGNQDSTACRFESFHS